MWYICLYGLGLYDGHKSWYSARFTELFGVYLHMWLNGICCAQIAMDDSPNVRLKFFSYVSDHWNFVDVLTIGTYIPGLVLRFIPTSTCGTCFYAACIIFAFNHMLFSFRILNMFAVYSQLGPKLIMIGRMVGKPTGGWLIGVKLTIKMYWVRFPVGRYRMVITWMGDVSLRTGKPPRYITNTKINSAVRLYEVGKSSTGLSGGGRLPVSDTI